MKTTILILLMLFMIGCSEGTNPTASGTEGGEDCNVSSNCYLEKTQLLMDARSDAFPSSPLPNQLHIKANGDLYIYNGTNWSSTGYTITE